MTRLLKRKNEQPKLGKPSLFKEIKKNYPFLLMLLPGVVILLLFCYKPMYGLLIAFKDYKFKLGVWGSPWAGSNGMEHFIRMFKNDNFSNALSNTVIISFLKLLLGTPGPIIFALLLNELRGKVYKRTVQTFTYLPYFFSWVVLGGIFKMLFSATGPVNSVLLSMGVGEPIPFFGSNSHFLWLIVLTDVWHGLGWGAIVYIAALSGVDESLYEAAYIDGAGKFKQVIHITLPCIMGTITTVFIMNLGNVLNAGFDQIYNMYNAMVYESSDILDTYALRLLQDGRYEVGTALGLFKSLIGMMFVLGANKLVKVISKDEYGVL